VYTLSDARYRFRVAVAPIPLFPLTYALSGLVGFGTLLTSIWFAEHWLIPNSISSAAMWQVTFALIFLVLALTWIWYAFIRPPLFSKRNSRKFARALYDKLLQGAESDLPIIADELSRSASSIIRLSAQTFPRPPGAPRPRLSRAAAYANDIMLMVGNRKLCRHIISSSPRTAMAFFQAMIDTEKYYLPMGQFAVNLSTEALINKDSILYHEDQGYQSGFFGYVRPFSNTIYGCYPLVEALSSTTHSPLDINFEVAWSWDAAQVKAYARAVLITLEGYLEAGYWPEHSYALYRALGLIRGSCRDVYKLDGSTDYYPTDIYERLDATVDFVKDAIELLGKQRQLQTTLRIRGDRSAFSNDLFDYMAETMFEIIFATSAVKSPSDTCWTIQHNVVWYNLFSSHQSTAWGIIRFKLRRLLYNEIRELERFPNYKSSRILGFCLNVMGFRVGEKKGYGSEQYALRKTVLAWTQVNFLKLVERQPEVAASCLTGGITFDKEHSRLVKTYAKGLELEAPKDYLDLR
jgi:hypothetical protein